MIPPCLILSNIRYRWRVKWSNSGKEVAASPTHLCSSYWKGSLLVTLDYGRHLYFSLLIYIYIYIYIYSINKYMCQKLFLLLSVCSYISISLSWKDIDLDRLSIIWKSDLTDKMKRSFFQAAVVSILLDGRTTWTLTKRLEKKLDGNYTRMFRAILNKSWRGHPTRHQLYGHLPPITKTIQVRRTRHAGHCWRSKEKLISDVLLWTPVYGPAKAGRSASNIHTAAMWGYGM